MYENINLADRIFQPQGEAVYAILKLCHGTAEIVNRELEISSMTMIFETDKL